MPTYVDPKTGEHFDNDAENADALAAQVGLVPKSQYDADNRPFLESAGEAVQAVGNTMLRPLEAIGDALPSGGSSDVNRRVADSWSPSSDDSRRIANEHPIASALPLAGEALLPGGPLVQMAAGTLGSAAEGTFQRGGQYGEVDPNELLTAAALGGGTLAAGPVLRGVSKAAGGVGDTIIGAAGAAKQGLAGAAGKAIASRAGRALTEDMVEDVVGGAMHGAGVIAGAHVGGLPGAIAGGYVGRRLNRKYGEKIVDAIYSASKGADTAGLGVAKGAARGAEDVASGVRASASAEGNPMWAPIVQPPIDPESVAMGTGFGPIFRKAEEAMSPTLKRAKEILQRREAEGGAVGVGSQAPTAPPRGRAARAAGRVDPLPDRDVMPTALYPDSNAARSEYGDAMYPHRDSVRGDNVRAGALADKFEKTGEIGAVNLDDGSNLSLGGIAKSPIGVVTGVGAAIGVGNVLARAERRANESVSFDDLDEMPEQDRRAALSANAPRYLHQANDSTVDALDGKTEAYVAAKGLARKRLGDLAADPSDAQRAYADTALMAIDNASQALRANGNGDSAKALDEVADSLTDVSAAHREKAPIVHSSSELLGQLDHAYDILRAQGTLPPDAQTALDELKQGTTRPELWGQAADMLADMRQADDGVDAHDITDSSDPDTWRQNLTEHVAAARHQVDVLDKWGVDTDKLTGKLDELSDAIDRGEAVTSELHAAGIRSSDGRTDAWDQGPAADILGNASKEMGGVDVEAVLAPSARKALEEQQRAYRYDTALRSVQRGSELQLKQAARGMVGLGSSTVKVDPDATNAAFSEGYSDEIAAFDARRSMIQQLGQDPMALADSMSTSYGELVKTHPEVYDQISSMVVRATDILTESMPPSILQSIQSPRGLPPSVDDVRAFSRVFMAVTEPETFLRDLGAGQAWPEQSQAFAKMYPQQWAKLAQTALQSAKQRGPELSPQEATYLDITFNVGNNLGGMWSDAGAKAISDAVTAAKQQTQDKAGKPPPGPAGATFPTMATQALGAGPSSTPVS